MKDFRRLEVWAKAHELTLLTYRITSGFPRDERFGLISQLRRCAASIPANIAEGCGRMTDGEFARFLQIAMGSANELDYHFLLARDLSFMDEREYRGICQKVVQVKSMLAPLLRKVMADRAKN